MEPRTSSNLASPSSRAWRRLAASPSARIGGTLVLLFVLIALTADYLAPYSENHTAEEVAEPPSTAHWLGTDALRKDVLSRVMFGSRLSLTAGVISILLAVSIGAPVGALAGFFGGWTDSLLMRAIDIALAFPSVLIALLVAAAYRPSWATVVIAVGLINVPIFARQVRATVLTTKELEFVLASRAFGASPLRILTRDILPSLTSPIIVLASTSLGTAILEVAGLSFLGIGGDPTAPEWGAMLAQAKDYWSKNVWFALAPGLAISLTVLGTNLLGDGLRDSLDPRTSAPLL